MILSYLVYTYILLLEPLNGFISVCYYKYFFIFRLGLTEFNKDLRQAAATNQYKQK